jgi:Zn-dependent M16 (insulinase) family peptidase
MRQKKQRDGGRWRSPFLHRKGPRRREGTPGPFEGRGRLRPVRYAEGAAAKRRIPRRRRLLLETDTAAPVPAWPRRSSRLATSGYNAPEKGVESKGKTMENQTVTGSLPVNPGDRCRGYRLERRVDLETINAQLFELEHTATGARHIHVANQDRENAFAVIFRTIPRDSTGVAHILEHTVLCGSRRFPVRDPFFSMIKRSLNTFMNAFTASDWTMYPFCTQNRKDYYNLMDVYLDSTFFPNLDELSFQQEGHRLEPVPDPGTSGGRQLVYKGVVYNEMKGAMSSPDQVMVRSMLNALYPDTTYRFNSGGDPAVIPKLTHEELKAFHAHHYHPSNALFYTYGNLPLDDHLAFIESSVLSRFERLSDLPVVANQKRWKKPLTAVYTYPLEEQEGLERKCQVSVAWLLSDIRDSLQVLSLTLLGQILLGNPASPLYKVLIESGMGTALADGTGYDADNRDTLFACGLKDVQAADADAIEALVLATLETLTDEGIESELVASAIHQLEFHRREVTNTPYPYGLKLLLGFAGPWLHGGDPVAAIAFDRDLATIRSEIEKGAYFEGLIRRWLLDNPHRVRLLLQPDPEKMKEEEGRVAGHLEQVMSALAPADIDALARRARDLEKRQQQVEDAACLPTPGTGRHSADGLRCGSPAGCAGSVGNLLRTAHLGHFLPLGGPGCRRPAR